MDERARALAQLSLVTNHFGDHEVFGDILQDWFNFLGGKPAQVVVVDGGSSAEAQQVVRELAQRGMIDTLDLLPAQDPVDISLRETAYIEEYKSGALARNPYILFFHADTLPYRNGHADWLVEALAYLQRPDVFAISGSFNLYVKQREAWQNWYWTDRCSLNFALMKRELFIASTEEYAGDFIRSNFVSGNPAAATKQDRFVIELAFEKYMATHQRLTLIQHEDPCWLVFHTNTRGARLKKTRADLYARKNITPYFDSGANPKFTLPQLAYYGHPLPGALKRARICFGQSRVGPSWRAFKQRLRHTLSQSWRTKF